MCAGRDQCREELISEDDDDDDDEEGSEDHTRKVTLLLCLNTVSINRVVYSVQCVCLYVLYLFVCVQYICPSHCVCVCVCMCCVVCHRSHCLTFTRLLG